MFTTGCTWYLSQYGRLTDFVRSLVVPNVAVGLEGRLDGKTVVPSPVPHITHIGRNAIWKFQTSLHGNESV